MGVSDKILRNSLQQIDSFVMFSDLQSCFNYLHGLVKGTSSEALLSSIINRLICIRDDPAIRFV